MDNLTATALSSMIHEQFVKWNEQEDIVEKITGALVDGCTNEDTKEEVFARMIFNSMEIAAGIVLAAFEPFKKFTTNFDNNAESRFYEEYKGINGTLKLIKDNIKDFTNDISTFENAMETVNEGIILTDEQMRKLSQSTGFCNDDIESLTEGMIDLHPELAAVREEFGLWDVYPETLSNIAQGVGLIKDGTVDAGRAFDEFRKPMWNMTEDVLTFFGQIQDGTINVSESHRAMTGEIRHNSSEMKTSITADNSEITVSNDALNDNYSDNAESVTGTMSDVMQGSDDLKDTFTGNRFVRDLLLATTQELERQSKETEKE